MAYELNSIDVVAYIRKKGLESGQDFNQTQLQKILYCCYGVMLALYMERLTEEYPVAWPYGPVFPKTLSLIRNEDWEKTKPSKVEKSLLKGALARLDQTIRFFGQFETGKLSGWSHDPESPWAKVTDNGKHVPTRMDDFLIYKYFKEEVDTEEALNNPDENTLLFQ